jgi:hypothetical protein
MKEYPIQSKPSPEVLEANPTWAQEVSPEFLDDLVIRFCPEVKIIRVRPEDAIEVLAEANGSTIFKVKEEVYALLSPEYCLTIEAAPIWPGDACLYQIFQDKDYGDPIQYGLHWLEKGRTYILHKTNAKLYVVESKIELNRIKELADQVNIASAELDLYLN